MQTTAITLRALQVQDIEAAMALSSDAGWNQTVSDWKFLLEAPQNICVAAVSNGKVIGTTVALDYAGKLAWIGMVLVNKEYRGKGISKLLLQYIFERYKASMKLDATALGEPVYRKFGFLPEYTIARMVNTKTPVTYPAHDHVLQQASPKHISPIVSLDEKVSGTGRSNLITYYMQQYPGKAWVLEENNRVDGFVLGRKGYRYHHIGPVVAATAHQAARLLMRAMEKLSGQPVVIDVLSDKKEMIQMLEGLGFSEQRQFVRMYKQHNLFPGNTHLLFAIAGPEFG